MTPEQVFSVVSTIALVTWVAMLLAPRRPLVVDRVAGLITPVLLALIYVVLIATSWVGSRGDFSSLAGVAALFSQEWLLLAGWIHYLAFDLLIGRWELKDSQSRRIPYLLVIPCLVLTFLFGPGGWLLYLGLRSAWGRRTGAAG